MYIARVTMAAIICATASAAVVAVGPSAFPTGATVINLETVPLGTEVNGLVVDGVTFSYTVGGMPTNGAVQIGSSPTTNNLTPPNIVSIGNATGILGMQLPTPTFLLGYGYAIQTIGTLPGATTISLFSEATPVGSLQYTGMSDPALTGGFAGIQSNIAFDRVQVVFLAGETAGFAMGNMRYVGTVSTVPEPSSAWLVIIGAALLGISRITPRHLRRRQFSR